MLPLRTCFLGLVALAMTTSAASGPPATPGRVVEPFTPSLRAGDYVWRPEVSPHGPVVILIRLDLQTLYVFRNGVRIGRSTISSGRPGNRTPLGAFTILEKQVKHVSTLYPGAQMPYMQRLTWRGVALHAGYLPGQPASHGCVRLPYQFAQKLYGITGLGTTVIVASNETKRGSGTQPGLLFQAPPTSAESTAPAEFSWRPELAPAGPVTIVVSTADAEVRVLRNGVEIGRTSFARGRAPTSLGTHIYTALDRRDSAGRRIWIATSSLGPSQPPDPRELGGQIELSPVFRSLVRGVIVVRHSPDPDRPAGRTAQFGTVGRHPLRHPAGRAPTRPTTVSADRRRHELPAALANDKNRTAGKTHHPLGRTAQVQQVI